MNAAGTRYALGLGTAVVGSRAIGLIDQSPADRAVQTLVEPILNDESSAAIFDRLFQLGIGELPSFGLVCFEQDDVRILVRGSVTVTATDADGSVTVHSGNGARSWNEQVIPVPVSLGIRLATALDGEIPAFSITAGSAPASIIDHLVAPADTEVPPAADEPVDGAPANGPPPDPAPVARAGTAATPPNTAAPTVTPGLPAASDPVARTDDSSASVLAPLPPVSPIVVPPPPPQETSPAVPPGQPVARPPVAPMPPANAEPADEFDFGHLLDVTKYHGVEAGAIRHLDEGAAPAPEPVAPTAPLIQGVPTPADLLGERTPAGAGEDVSADDSIAGLTQVFDATTARPLPPGIDQHHVLPGEDAPAPAPAAPPTAPATPSTSDMAPTPPLDVPRPVQPVAPVRAVRRVVEPPTPAPAPVEPAPAPLTAPPPAPGTTSTAGAGGAPVPAPNPSGLISGVPGRTSDDVGAPPPPSSPPTVAPIAAAPTPPPADHRLPGLPAPTVGGPDQQESPYPPSGGLASNQPAAAIIGGIPAWSAPEATPSGLPATGSTPISDHGSGEGEEEGEDSPTIGLAALRATQAKAMAPAAGATVQAVHCSMGHPNPPYGDPCRQCGQPITDRAVTTIGRPALGQLRFADGDVTPLDQPLVIGRKPQDGALVGGEPARAIRLPDPDMVLSRTHIEVRLVDWQVQIVDRDSMNHTFVEVPGHAPTQLRPAEPFPISLGSKISLGDSITFTYEVAPQ